MRGQFRPSLWCQSLASTSRATHTRDRLSTWLIPTSALRPSAWTVPSSIRLAPRVHAQAAVDVLVWKALFCCEDSFVSTVSSSPLHRELFWGCKCHNGFIHGSKTTGSFMKATTDQQHTTTISFPSCLNNILSVHDGTAWRPAAAGPEAAVVVAVAEQLYFSRC